MRVTLCGVRGSIPTPDADKLRYGGNTSCVSVELERGQLILDAGSGIRNLGARVFGRHEEVHILLTHLHLDHIMGLLFFAPLFDPEASVTVWGPRGAFRDLRRRLSRYLSTPLSPIEMRELPAQVAYREVPSEAWELCGARVQAGLVSHRGTTLGYRIDENGNSLCYLPDHEPALGADLRRSPPEWISGASLASGVDLLIHDAQYTRPEYEGTIGWGHSTFEDALCFAERAEAERVLLFHHDPTHEDELLDRLHARAVDVWTDRGGDAAQIEMAAEGSVHTLSDR
jgi:phosphoribosyl 1,2-cyclic phosphodiesterase